jgi:hypothetical protein
MPQNTYQDKEKKEKAMLDFQNKNCFDQEAYAETLLLKKMKHAPLS